MSVEIITKEDLNQFRIALMIDFKTILATYLKAQTTPNEWLRGAEVKKMLKISTGTLQNLRVSGKLKPSRIGGIIYYRGSEIEKLFQK